MPIGAYSVSRTRLRLTGDDEVPTPSQDRWSYRTSRYGALSIHFDRIYITRHPGVRVGLPRTSMDTLWSGLDSGALDRIVRQKLERLAGYRESPDVAQKLLPVWLVVHIDEWPLSACVPEPLIAQAIEVTRERLQRWPGDGFDSVWLLHSLYGETVLHPV